MGGEVVMSPEQIEAQLAEPCFLCNGRGLIEANSLRPCFACLGSGLDRDSVKYLESLGITEAKENE